MRAAPSALVSLLWLLWWRPALTLTINRHHKGDMLVESGPECGQNLCDAHIARTADSDCACQCPNHLPVFRDDLLVCVDDIHECSLAPFVTGSVSQRMPFVFLPLEGQIIYPSAEISFSGIDAPVCSVIGAEFLDRGGWTDIKTVSESQLPFKLYKDEGRSYLQWLGETTLRLRMEGRLILVRLHCRDSNREEAVSKPCVAFRVAGTPIEAERSAVVYEEEFPRTGLSVSEYAAIGVSTLLLALVYVAGVLVYICRHRNRRGRDSQNSSPPPKAKPLLVQEVSSVSLADSDSPPASDDDSLRAKVTTALVHPLTALSLSPVPLLQSSDSGSCERHPEEDVSIVETLDDRTDNPRNICCGPARRKLYFNPAFFEPELLKAPPPAAVEFLTKIREVIAISKNRMVAKKFSPSLLGIPEEPSTSAISLKRDNSRRRSTLSSPASVHRWLQAMSQHSENDVHHCRVNAVEPAGESAGSSGTSNGNCPIPPPLPKEPPNVGQKKPLVIAKKAVTEEKRPARSAMDAVIKELSMHGGREAKPPRTPSKDKLSNTGNVKDKPAQREFELDSLERNAESSKEIREDGFETPPEYKDLPPLSSPSPMSALPLEEELTMRNEIFNVVTGNTTISKLKYKNVGSVADDNDYEIIAMKDSGNGGGAKPPNPDAGPVRGKHGYSLVSEVYVNDGYNSSSVSSTSSSSTHTPKIMYDEPDEKPGHLTIQVEDSPENYVYMPDDSDSFEPDTLDRKPTKPKYSESVNIASEKCQFVNERFNDSLERPSQILLRTTGSFRIDSLSRPNSVDMVTPPSPFTRAFGSLREIYEAKTKGQQFYRSAGREGMLGSTHSVNSDNESSTLSWRRNILRSTSYSGLMNTDYLVSRRQRAPPALNIPDNTPDVIPPLPPKTQALYQSPASPARPIHTPDRVISPPLPPRVIKPPLPPKNGISRSASLKSMISQPSRKTSTSSLNGDIMSSIRLIQRDEDNYSTRTGASVDSLNSSDYEEYYNPTLSGQTDFGNPIDQQLQIIVRNHLVNSRLVEAELNRRLAHQLAGLPDLRQYAGKKLGVPPATITTHQEDYLNQFVDQLSIDGDPGMWRPMWSGSGGDSGIARSVDHYGSVSDTDTESLCDGASESGGESIATDSVFFGSFRKLPTCAVVSNFVGRPPVTRTSGNSEGGSHVSDVEKTGLLSVPRQGNIRANSIR